MFLLFLTLVIRRNQMEPAEVLSAIIMYRTSSEFYIEPKIMEKPCAKPTATEIDGASEATPAEEESSFTVKFKTMTGKVFELDCKSNDTVGSCKDRLSELSDTPAACLMFMNGTKKVKDDSKTLADVGINSSKMVRLIIRLMNVITVETMKGIHYWIKNQNPSYKNDKCMVENDEFYYSDNTRTRWNFVVKEEGFGFTTKSGTEFIYVPTGILPGLISVTRPNDNSYLSFWVREGAFANPKVIAEIQKTWPDFTYEAPEDDNSIF